MFKKYNSPTSPEVRDELMERRAQDLDERTIRIKKVQQARMMVKLRRKYNFLKNRRFPGMN